MSLGLGDEPVYISSASLFFFPPRLQKALPAVGWGGRQLRSITLVCGIILWLRVCARTCATGKHTFTYRLVQRQRAHTVCVYIFTHELRHVLGPTVSLALPDRHKTLFSLSRTNTNTHKRKCVFPMGHPVSQRALQERASVQTFRSRRGR